jgi:CBS domain-containing protein
MLRIKDVMTTDVLTVDPQLSIRDAMELLSMNHVTGAPVVSGRKVIGVISATDLLGFASQLTGVPTQRPDVEEEWNPGIDEAPVLDGDDPLSAYFLDMWDDAGADATVRYASVSGPEWNVLEQHTVSEAMVTTPLKSLPPNATVKEAADCMRKESIHRVLVMEGDELVGIVTASDITRAASQEKLGKRVYVFPDQE